MRSALTVPLFCLLLPGAAGWPTQAQMASKPAAGTVTLPLWTGTPPDAGAAQPSPEANTTKPSDPWIAGDPVIRLGNVSSPTLTFYKPKTQPTGAAVVVFPGGGYSILAIDLEGTEVCEWLSGAGIACVLVKYRVPGSGPYPKSSAALDDAQRAMGLVRRHAAEWGIDPKKVGVLGFSAGGHLAAALSTHWEKRLYPLGDMADGLPCRPDFAVIVYPGYLAPAEQNYAPNPAIQPTSTTPPTFLLQAEDDPEHVENAITYFLQLKAAKVPAEMHIYAMGGHGYGLRKTSLPITGWPLLVEHWMVSIGMMPTAYP